MRAVSAILSLAKRLAKHAPSSVEGDLPALCNVEGSKGRRVKEKVRVTAKLPSEFTDSDLRTRA